MSENNQTMTAGRAKFMSLVEEVDRQMCELHDQPMGTFIEILVAFLPTLLGLLPMCKKPVPAPPPDPTPSPTPARTSAWVTANEAKFKATDAWLPDENDFMPHALNLAQRKIKQDARKKGGEKLTRTERVDLARNGLMVTKDSDMETLASSIEAHNA